MRPKAYASVGDANHAEVELESAHPGAEELTISFGMGTRPAEKDQDRIAAHAKDARSPSVFGVFDGHNGSKAAARCAEALCERIGASETPCDPATLCEAFWAIDEEIGLTASGGGGSAAGGGDRASTSTAASGTTASVLVARPLASSRGTRL